MITGLRGLIGCALMIGVVGPLYAEQITSTCKITAVDATAHTVTLVRKTASGERTGVAKIADAVKVTVDGRTAPPNTLQLPVDATVVYDTAANAVVEIRVGASMAIPGPKPTGEPPPLAIAPFDAAKAKEHQAAWAKYLGVPVEMTNSVGMKFVLIPPGEFQMGASQADITQLLQDSQNKRFDQWFVEYIRGEGPQHRVRITSPFYLCAHEVTQGEYEKVMNVNPSSFTTRQLAASGFGSQLAPNLIADRDADVKKVAGLDTNRYPVEFVSWLDALEFCRKCSELAGERPASRVYRLPKDAEWEYACRAGTETHFYFGNDDALLGDYAWWAGNSSGATKPVGMKKPNPWGLHDMLGNVHEMCADWYGVDYYQHSPLDNPEGPVGGTAKVLRGSSWFNDSPVQYWSAFRRDNTSPDRRDHRMGFRVVFPVK